MRQRFFRRSSGTNFRAIKAYKKLKGFKTWMWVGIAVLVVGYFAGIFTFNKSKLTSMTATDKNRPGAETK